MNLLDAKLHELNEIPDLMLGLKRDRLDQMDRSYRYDLDNEANNTIHCRPCIKLPITRPMVWVKKVQVLLQIGYLLHIFIY